MWWLLFVAVALGAPVELPPGETAATWSHALTTAGLEPGPVGSGEGVRIVADGTQWHLLVRDAEGVERRATVPVPRTAAAREEVCALAASLLHPVGKVAAMPLPELPPLPPPTRKTAPAAAAATVAAAPTPAPTITAPVTITVPSTSTSTSTITVPSTSTSTSTSTITVPSTSTSTVPEPVLAIGVLETPPEPGSPPVEITRPHARAWWSVAPLALRLRSRVAVSWAPAAWLGVVLPQPVRLGVGVEGILPGALYQIPEDQGTSTLSSVDGRVLAAWAPGPFELGATGGVSRRVATGLDPTWMGVVGGMTALRVTVPRAATLRFAASVERDLAPTDLWIGPDVAAGRLPPLSANLSIAVCGGDGSLRRVRSTADRGRPR